MLILDKEINLGILKFGCAKNFTINISNGYEEDVLLGTPILGCNACTSATLDKFTIPPGQSACLSATFTPGSTGFQTKHITIPYSINSVDQPSIVIKFKSLVNG